MGGRGGGQGEAEEKGAIGQMGPKPIPRGVRSPVEEVYHDNKPLGGTLGIVHAPCKHAGFSPLPSSVELAHSTMDTTKEDGEGAEAGHRGGKGRTGDREHTEGGLGEAGWSSTANPTKHPLTVVRWQPQFRCFCQSGDGGPP